VEVNDDMPKMTKSDRPIREELPDTLKRSPKSAQRTFAKAHDSAAEEYGEGRRAHQTAYATLKRTHEKVGDHWEQKDGSGPSDAQARGGRSTNRETAGGVDANASKEHLYELAQKRDIKGRSSMSKPELVDALRKDSRRSTKGS
jgi:cation transport regulator ChaB